MRTNYNTRQKSKILETIKSIKTDFTINDIYLKLSKEVGLTTIYRMVAQLEKEGFINQVIKNNKQYYEYLEKCDKHNHFYLKCMKCDALIHIDCDCINELSTHIEKEHGFIPNEKRIIINGLCAKCQKVGEIK